MLRTINGRPNLISDFFHSRVVPLFTSGGGIRFL